MAPHRRFPTPSEVAGDFDRLAQLPGTTSDHNSRYYPLMLRYLPERTHRVLDVGCGAGELARLLASRAEKVEGIDLAPEMIARARQATPAHRFPHVAYSCADLLQAGLPTGAYDAIVSVATLHHMPLADALWACYRALRPGGVLIILDLYEAATVADHLAFLLAGALGLASSYLRRSAWRLSQVEAGFWAEHGSKESYPTLAEVRRVADKVFPAARLRRLLHYRYLLVGSRAG